ncbi:MAG: ABC transporter permease [Theionarchaea archaeon]|nr:MAG: branched-chain amino acid ABC transporter permease [Theionarchaea archaeon DG-70]MBU7009332.1 ABC transporter permease [Theionarchaea archaeon]
MLSSIVSLLTATLRISPPIALASIGGAYSERTGIINIGLEGMILMGAFAGVATTHFVGNPWVGVLSAVLAGGALGLLHAVLCIRFKANQVVSGVGVNILSLGLTTLLLQVIWGNRGASDSVRGLRPLSLPVIRDIPIIGDILGEQNPLVYLMLVIVVVAWLVMFRTPLGLRIRAVGEHPEAADTVGIHVHRIQYMCVTLSGMLSGLGGAYLSLGWLNLFSQNMSAGRGFIALAANIFGKWNPAGAFGASLLFSFTDALQIKLQGVGIPIQFIQMIPYILTILVLASAVKRAVPPAAIGKHYEKGEK